MASCGGLRGIAGERASGSSFQNGVAPAIPLPTFASARSTADGQNPQGAERPAERVGAQGQGTQQSGDAAPVGAKPRPGDLPDAPAAKSGAREENAATEQRYCTLPPCYPPTNWYMRFLNGPAAHPLTAKEKGWLATRGILDPFNGITILGTAAISVGADSHSAYGPGLRGFVKNVGVSYTEDITGEFIGTFLIPSLTHQDPRYHRLPKARMAHRIVHAITQVVWTQSDYGRPMPNYANLVGFAIQDSINNLYVPGRDTTPGASAQRYATGLATAPIDNFITEFLPDVAGHIHVRIVLVQRIINQVALKENSAP